MTDQPSMLGADEVAALFTRSTGEYLFARWGRPIVPVVFGVDAATLATVKGAVEAVVVLAGHKMAETDPELGANLMVFFFRDWQELLEVPNLDHMIDGLQDLVARLDDQGANQYRVFRFDPDGAIRACFSFVRMDAALDEVPAETIALSQAVQMVLLWSDQAFAERSPLAVARGVTVLRPDIAAVIRAAYDSVMPAVAQDASHALRLAARVGAAEGGA
ncbi:hypothetical protein LZA78_09000 [Sinirhodobacter sp. WL0062]|uniref:Uncharacterized protein n=1 Tax=Rhodobacter flavimaris TaxID=2907145 RepID=A0ABS8YWE5_9RHOB|nr:hypothetical protein [Sinirhodobacter sp. WL0062]MCE5973615.1 hypothetical protein [Sinirhodobacter sp. WL0062]